MVTKRRTRPVEPNTTHLVEVDDPKFQAGDTVRVVGEQGRFSFCGRKRNTKTGQEWLDLYGGSGGVKLMRSVAPERVRKVSSASKAS